MHASLYQFKRDLPTWKSLHAAKLVANIGNVAYVVLGIRQHPIPTASQRRTSRHQWAWYRRYSAHEKAVLSVPPASVMCSGVARHACHMTPQWNFPCLEDIRVYIDGLVQDCSNSIALAMELLQLCTKPSTWAYMAFQTKGNSTICSASCSV